MEVSRAKIDFPVSEQTMCSRCVNRMGHYDVRRARGPTVCHNTAPVGWVVSSLTYRIPNKK